MRKEEADGGDSSHRSRGGVLDPSLGSHTGAPKHCVEAETMVLWVPWT